MESTNQRAAIRLDGRGTDPRRAGRGSRRLGGTRPFSWFLGPLGFRLSPIEFVFRAMAAGSLRRGPEKRRMRESGVQIFSTRRTRIESQITFFADRIRLGRGVSRDCAKGARAALF